jgi:hypothetical protein
MIQRSRRGWATLAAFAASRHALAPLPELLPELPLLAGSSTSSSELHLSAPALALLPSLLLGQAAPVAGCFGGPPFCLTSSLSLPLSSSSSCGQGRGRGCVQHCCSAAATDGSGSLLNAHPGPLASRASVQAQQPASAAHDLRQASLQRPPGGRPPARGCCSPPPAQPCQKSPPAPRTSGAAAGPAAAAVSAPGMAAASALALETPVMALRRVQQVVRR